MESKRTMKHPKKDASEINDSGVSRWLLDHDGWLRLAQIIVIPLTLGLSTFFLTFCNSQKEQRLAEDKRFVEIIDKLEATINTDDAQSVSVDGHPALGLTQKGIHEMDSKARIYLGMLGPKEKLRMLLFLYNIGFIKHTYASSGTYPGTIGLCRSQPDPKKLLYCNITSAGLPLDGLDAPNQDIHQMKLVFSSLKGSSFQGSDLHGAELMGSNMNNSSFSDADLTGSYLISANLKNANFAGAVLTGANFHCANLSGADVRKSKWDKSNPPKYNTRTRLAGMDPAEKAFVVDAWELDKREKFKKFEKCPYDPKKDDA